MGINSLINNNELKFILSYGSGNKIMDVVPVEVYNQYGFEIRESDKEECIIFVNDENDKVIKIPLKKVLKLFSDDVIFINKVCLKLDVNKEDDLKDDYQGDLCAVMDSLDNLDASYEFISEDDINLGRNYSVVPIPRALIKIKTKSIDKDFKENKNYDKKMYFYEDYIDDKQKSEEPKKQLRL